MNSSDNKAAILATQELKALFEIACSNRQVAWYNRLLTCLPHAIFTSGEPEIIFNNAGLTYYNLELAAENDMSKTNYHIPDLIDNFLVNEGVGIAIKTGNPKQAIDLSYGDILGFHLHRTFAEPEKHSFKTDKPRAHLIRAGAELLISEVPSNILPANSVHLLEAVMQHFGVKSPKVMLVYLPETEQYEIVFSIGNTQLAPPKVQALVKKLGWFLPRYYSYLACDLSNISSLAKQ